MPDVGRDVKRKHNIWCSRYCLTDNIAAQALMFKTAPRLGSTYIFTIYLTYWVRHVKVCAADSSSDRVKMLVAPRESRLGVRRVGSLLKRWLLGTHQGAVRPPHLDYYLDEFTFRFNPRSDGAGATVV
jgi:hypothetical protein